MNHDPSGYVIRVHGPVRGKQRARSGNGRHYTPAQTVERERLIRLSAQQQHPEVTGHDDGALEWAMDVTFRRDTLRHAGDIDNLLKVALDALNGWAYKDDRQVTRSSQVISLTRGRPPLTVIHLYPR